MTAVGLRGVDAPAVLGASDLSGFFECDQGFSEPVVVDAELGAQLRPGKRSSPMKEVHELALQGNLRRLGAQRVLDLEVAGSAVSEACETEDHRFGCACGSVFQGEEDVLTLASEVGVGVTEGVQVRTSAQGLTRLGMGLLAGVVDDDQGQVEGSLQVAEVPQEPGDILAAVLIERMQAHQDRKSTRLNSSH